MSERLGKVLVVDDEPLNVRILEGILNDQYDIVTATSGKEALELARDAALDLVLLDVMMPGLDGYEVCRLLKAETVTRSVPVVFITARDDDQDEALGFELGGADYITKPVSPPIVRARVRNQVELKRYRDYLEEQTWRDGLTGIANRRRFDDFLAFELLRGRRNDSPVGLVLVDIDNFKAYNDHYGHLAGDACLRQVALTLASAVRRSTDLVARYGGEEFACVLPDTDGPGTLKVAEVLRDAVAELALDHVGTRSGQVSVSAGAASAWATDGVNPETLVDAADRSLYSAKASGRDRVGPIGEIEPDAAVAASR